MGKDNDPWFMGLVASCADTCLTTDAFRATLQHRMLSGRSSRKHSTIPQRKVVKLCVCLLGWALHSTAHPWLPGCLAVWLSGCGYIPDCPAFFSLGFASLPSATH